MPSPDGSATDVTTRTPRRWGWWIMLLLVLGAATGLSGILTDRPLDTHEIFVAQTTREMLASGDWVHPTFNARPRLNKPPLQYWLVGGLATATGNQVAMPPWVARLPSLAAGLALILITVAIGRSLFDRRTGLLAGGLLIATVGFFEYTNSARAEMLYAAVCGGFLLFLIRASAAPDRSRRQFVSALAAWACLGVGVLAKGPHVPLLLMAGVAIALAALGERRRMLGVLRPLTGLAVALLICLPWIVAMVLANEGTLAHWAQQMFADRPVEASKGIWNFLSPYYLYAFPLMLLPAGVLLPLGLFVSFEKHRPDLRRGLLLLVPVLLTILIMGLSTHRRDYYLLGLLGPMCVLMARGAIDLSEKLAGRNLWIGRRGIAVIATGTLVAIGVLIGLGRTRMPWSTDRWNAAAFGEKVAAAAADGRPVSVLRTDPDALVYFVARPITIHRTTQDLAEAVRRDGPTWVILPPKLIDQLDDAGLVGVERAVLDTSGGDNEPRKLVLVTAADPDDDLN